MSEMSSLKRFNEGIDLISSSISLSLSAAGRFDVENLSLTGGAVFGIGNALDNQIVGTNFANNLNGLAGNDSLFGLGGNDAMFGGIGNDFLNGGAGYRQYVSAVPAMTPMSSTMAVTSSPSLPASASTR